MPELPEVEVLARHLGPALRGKTIRDVQVRRARVIRPTPEAEIKRTLTGATFTSLSRRGKYLLFELRRKQSPKTVTLLGHLGMSGRMFVTRKDGSLPRHAAVVLDLGREEFIFEDTRYFGRLTLDLSAVDALGPEPLSDDFSVEYFVRELKRSRQPIKVKLLDQALVAGVGNIYASEALFRAKISPKRPANRLTVAQVNTLRKTIRAVLLDAIECGSTLPLNFSKNKSDGLFYHGRAVDAEGFYEERLQVYGRAGEPCLVCGTRIKRIVQAARSTFYCPKCQKA